MRLMLALLAAAYVSPMKEYRTVPVASGIWAFVAPEGRSGLVSGNSIAIAGDDGVLVVDSGHFPTLTRRMISEIRKLAGKPVRWLVNTHWHPDHHFGNSAYREAYPGITIVSTEYTREQMARQAGRYDTPDSLRKIVPVIKDRLASGRKRDGTELTDGDRAYYAAILEDIDAAIPELAQAKPAPPDVGFEQKLTVHLGKRTVEILFLGRGNTGGDAVVYVPDAKVLMTGDLLVLPTPYAIGSFFSDWIGTLDRLQSIEADAIVPGHGPVQRDKASLVALRELLQTTLSQARECARKGLSLEQGRGAIDLGSSRRKFAGEDPVRLRAFDDAYAQPGIARAYREAKEGPLRDED